MAEPELGAGDPIAALIEWLTLDDAILEAVGDDPTMVMGPELRLGLADRMPIPCVVVSAAGGFAQGLPEVIDRVRVDTRSYGRTHDEAMRLAFLVRQRMKALTRYVSTLGVVVHAPVRNGGYIPLKEQAGGWPLVLRSYLTLFDERAAA